MLPRLALQNAADLVPCQHKRIEIQEAIVPESRLIELNGAELVSAREGKSGMVGMPTMLPNLTKRLK